jgi:hypothetical protein
MPKVILSALAVIALSAAMMARPAQAPRRSVAERLGYKATDRLLIINGDDTGMCHSANVATIDALDNGLLTSATIMVPCPWFTEIVRYAKSKPNADLGVHLDHTAEWQVYRWAPLLSRKDVPGLFDEDGYMWHGVEQVYSHAKASEAKAEAEAQIQRALKAGIDVTHIDSHMGTMQYNAAFHKAYIELARKYDLPLRMGSQETYEKAGFPNIRRDAEAAGLVFTDRLIHEERPAQGETRKDFWLRMIRELKPGITELYIHASTPTDEAKAISGSWQARATDYELFTRDPDIRKAIEDGGIIRIGYRALRDLQRKERASK